jgi:hypothetical protein
LAEAGELQVALSIIHRKGSFHLRVKLSDGDVLNHTYVCRYVKMAEIKESWKET